MSITCPICNSILTLEDRSYKCENNHSYDVAKEGYVHLLPVQNKNSKNPGDNKEMINARRSFLSKRYYDPLVEIIIPLLSTEKNKVLLDSGCGEGYYSALIANKTDNLSVIGFDISKEAIKKAAKKYKEHHYFVGSVNHIPVSAESADYILTIFAPINVNQFDNALAADGQLIIVSAGEQHMKEIAESIYDTFNPHSYDPRTQLTSHFELLKDVNTTFTITLTDNEDKLNLLKMTPYFWSAKEDTINKIINSIELIVTCDFRIQVFIKK